MRQILITLAILSLGFSTNGQDFLDWDRYKQLFNHVQDAPDSIENDPVLLVNYLKEIIHNDRELIEIIYYWFSDNIVYDIKGYSKSCYGKLDAQSVLESKKSVCEGYANLFKLLCNQANLECEVIPGYAKGHGYMGQREYETNHTWNVIKLNGTWKLVDVTWGSGYVDTENDSLIYKKNLNLGYLFSKPEGFVIEHFPEDEKWQLLEPPITIEEFYSDTMDSKIEHIYRYLR